MVCPVSFKWEDDDEKPHGIDATHYIPNNASYPPNLKS